MRSAFDVEYCCMEEDSAAISNQNTGDSGGPVIQVGVVHGDMRVHTRSRQPEAALQVSVTTTIAGSRTYHDGGAEAHPVYEVHMFVEAFTAQAVILHQLRPVLVRRFEDATAQEDSLSELSPREFCASLDRLNRMRSRLDAGLEQQALQPEPDRSAHKDDLPQPTLFDAGIDQQALQLNQDRSAQKNDFPFFVTESEPEYFVIRPEGTGLVEWQLELNWSSLGRHGTVVIDNGGAPFLFDPR